MGMPAYINLDEFIPSRLALEQLPEEFAKRLKVLPVALNKATSVLTLAYSAEPSLPVRDSVRRCINTSLEINWVKADPALIIASIDNCYHLQHDVLALIEQCWLYSEKSVAIPALLDALLCRGVDARASDIHISANNDVIELRLRIDGVISLLGKLPISILDALTVRVKIVSELDIAETRRAQDGQFRRLINGVFIECRVSTFPTCQGENMVIRLLDQEQRNRTLRELSLPDSTARQLRDLAQQPSGMLVVCGPTGSGKSSTLFCLLAERDITTLNVMSLEDPVEIRLAGIRQSNVDTDHGLGFASGVRALLRQDPDVLLIGEMRDADSVAMAFRAAMTGHQVLTTVHATDTFSTIDRLRELGVSAEVLSSTVRGIVAQRLLRKRCEDCCTQDHVEKHDFAGGVKCTTCHGTGYFGRQAIVEVLRFTSSIRNCIMAHGSTQELVEHVQGDGFSSLRDAANSLLRAGLTSQAEIDRVLGREVTGL